MGFSTATITSGPTTFAAGGDLRVTWTTSASASTTFQVYVNRSLTWIGTGTVAFIPHVQDYAYVDVISVDPGSEQADYSASLAALPGRTALITWVGGRYLGVNIVGYNIYSGTTPGGAVSYAAPIAYVPAGSQGLNQDGYGMGVYGSGGYGMSGVSYAYSTKVLKSGTWNFAIKTVDSSGNLSTASTLSVAISAPPTPPSKAVATVNPSTRVPTINWTASP